MPELARRNPLTDGLTLPGSAGKSVLSTTLEHEGGDLSEKLTLAYAHSLMAYPTTWHVAAAYLAWCPCHGEEAMQQLLSQTSVKVSYGVASAKKPSRRTESKRA